MKLRKWICPVLIAVCLAVSGVYGMIDRLSTDDAAPQISIGTEMLQLAVNDPESALLQGVTAEDDRDGDVTDSLIVESLQLLDENGKVRVCYAVFDKSGNVAKAEREAQYTDYQSPRFALSAPLAFPQTASTDVLDIITAQDALDGDISHRVRASNLYGVSISAMGSYEVLFSVTNSLGDTAQLQLPVEVYAAGRYNATLMLTDYLVYLPVGGEFAAESYLDGCTMGGATTSLESGLPEGYSLQTEGSVDTQVPGIYILDYELSYSGYTGYSRLIVVVEG